VSGQRRRADGGDIAVRAHVDDRARLGAVGGEGVALEQFAWLWLGGGGDGSGPAPSDDEAIELLTTILHSGIAGRG
jgi:hypothetical protein